MEKLCVITTKENVSKGDLTFNSPTQVLMNGKQGGVQYLNDYAPPPPLRVVKLDGPFDEKGQKVTLLEKEKWYTYKVIQFNRAPKEYEIKGLKWATQYDDKLIIHYPSVIGEKEVKFKISNNNTATEFTVYAYLEKPIKSVSISIELNEKIYLFLQFFATGKFGGNLYSESAQTRLQNIKGSKWYNEKIHKVHGVPYQDMSEPIEIMKNYINKYGGKNKVFTREVGFFSHAGGDGPLSSEIPSKFPVDEQNPHQMSLEGWETIDFNWDKGKAMFIVYGCDSALESPPEDKPQRKNYLNFAKNISKLSNFKDVEVWGQSSKSCPSFVPDYRVTSEARNHLIGGWDGYKTYQIAAPMGGGWKATCFYGPDVFKGEDIEHIQEEHDKANPMYCYKNDAKIRSTHQGYFNDHRKL